MISFNHIIETHYSDADFRLWIIFNSCFHAIAAFSKNNLINQTLVVTFENAVWLIKKNNV